MGDKINEFENLKSGKLYEVYINISSREWKGKYFSNIKGWKANLVAEDNNDDLPF